MIPQIVKMAKTKHADDVSLGMIFLYCINSAIWTTYGWLIGATPVMIANAAGFVIGIVQLVLKKRYSQRSPNLS